MDELMNEVRRRLVLTPDVVSDDALRAAVETVLNGAKPDLRWAYQVTRAVLRNLRGPTAPT